MNKGEKFSMGNGTKWQVADIEKTEVDGKEVDICVTKNLQTGEVRKRKASELKELLKKKVITKFE